MRLLFAAILCFTIQANGETMTKRYPDYNHSKDGACRDAERHVKLKASDECNSRIDGTIQTSCFGCTMKKRFGTKTWTCSGRAKYKCRGTSKSQTKSDDESNLGDKGTRYMRGKLRQHNRRNNLGGPCLQFPNSEKCRQWKKNYQKAVGGSRG